MSYFDCRYSTAGQKYHLLRPIYAEKIIYCHKSHMLGWVSTEDLCRPLSVARKTLFLSFIYVHHSAKQID